MNTEIMTARYQKFLPARLKPILPAWLICTVVLWCWVAPTTRAADGTPVWTNRYAGSGNGSDTATAMAVDGSGNVFVTGYSEVSFNGSSDYATIKYSGAGVALWTNRYNGPGNANDYANAVAVDGSGDVFVTGYSYGSSGLPDYATIKYSSVGVALWTNRYNGPGNGGGVAKAVAVDGSGNVFVTGYEFGISPNNDYATIKYSGAGVALWTNRYNGPGNGNDEASAMTVDGSGNVFVTGTSDVSSGSSDYATIKYSGAGVALWTNRYNGLGNGGDNANAVAVDGSGNAFVTGYEFVNSGNADYATIKYSSAGVALWTNHYNGPGNGYDQASAMAVDGSGNVFVTGYSAGSGSGSDYATIKYSAAGVALWTNRYAGSGNAGDAAKAVAVDGNGNAFVTGYEFVNSGNADYATIKYSSAGVALWTNRYNGPNADGSDIATAVVVDGNGNVFITGYSPGSVGGYDYATIKYSGPPTPPTISGPRIIGNGMVATLTGLTPGQKVISEASSSLTDWTPVQTNTAAGPSLSITNPYSTSVAAKFYRISVQ